MNLFTTLWRRVAPAALAVCAGLSATAAPFTPGNYVVARVGDGSAALSSAATAVFLIEYTPAGAVVQTIALPTATSGANRALTASGTSTAELNLTRSADGQYLVLTGYDAAPGTAAITGTAATANNRVIARIAADGTVNTSTVVSDAFGAGSIRAAASADGSGFYAVGANSGVRYVGFGGTGTSVAITTAAPTNIRSVNTFGGNLYVTSASGTTQGVAQVGTGLPTASAAITLLPGFPTATGPSPYSFYFADLSTAVAGVDVVYVADDRSTTAGGIQKWSLVAGTWTLNGTIGGVATAALRGLGGSIAGTTVSLVASGGGGVYAVSDNAGYNAAPSAAALPATALATAAANSAFRGVAFAPVASAVLAPTITSFTPASGPVGTVITVTGANLSGATAAAVNGTAGTALMPMGATSLMLTVAAGSTSGPITVTTPGGTATSTGSFTVTSAATAPAIASFTPASGVAGTSIVVTGTNLTGTTAVALNGTAAPGFVVNAAGTQLTVAVPVGATTGTLTIAAPGGTATSATSFAVDQPRAGRVLLDGYREALYGAAQALQTAATGFGNSTSGTQLAASGSELDGAYTRVSGDSLYVFLAGNLENNGNMVDVFFDSQTGGQNVLSNANPNVDNNGLNNTAGLTFDTGFAADYYLGLKGTATGVTAHFASLGATGTGISPASSGTGRVLALNLGNGRAGTLAFDQSNTGGVDGTAVSAGLAGAVVTGLEFVLPLAALGTPSGSLRVAAFVNGGSHDYLSNQVLAGLPAGTANLATASAVNFNTYAGNQYFTVTLPAATPAPVITGIAPATGPVGTVVTVTGTNLTGATALTLSGVAVTGFTVVNATTITFAIPAGATTGPVAVTTPGGTATSTGSFTVTAPAATPTLSTLSPVRAVVGGPAFTLTITGTNFTATTQVDFRGTTYTVATVNATGTSATVSIPASAIATTGQFLVSATNGGTASGTRDFFVVPAATTISYEDFEQGPNRAYADAAPVNLRSGAWTFSEALIGDQFNDRVNQVKSARLRGAGFIAMNFDKPNGAGTVTVQAATYGADAAGGFKLEISTNGGTSYTQVGADVTSLPTTLTTYTFTPNVAGAVRLKFTALGTGTTPRINLDDITISNVTAVRQTAGPVLAAYPVPATDLLTLGLPGATLGGQTATVRDLTGRRVAELPISAQAQVSLRGLAAGSYLLETQGRTVRVTKE